MRAARDDVELLNKHDAAFHQAVASATGNQTLASLLEGISGRTVRARVWRGMVDGDVADRTLAQHQEIYDALAAGDAALAEAAALIHVSTTEAWLRRHLTPAAQDAPHPEAACVRVQLARGEDGLGAEVPDTATIAAPVHRPGARDPLTPCDGTRPQARHLIPARKFRLGNRIISAKGLTHRLHPLTILV